ncbi:MAG: squalene/phytoene synthase family protein [Rhodobacterales bacterium]|nr:squalene/phytoene synthase family protein [Rhodobacterales bacterium]NCT13436.1 squalene/phytoene synthase family protein [Rhodobacterales bacterium]
MTLAACAALVERGDPDRFLATMAAPVAARAALFTLYAFNLEVARAPWITREPLIARMRLQWWRDVVAEADAGGAPRGHEVAGPLSALIRDRALPGAVFATLITAREWDIDGAAFAREEDVIGQIDRGAGSLAVLAALALGGDAAQEVALREAAIAGGIANWLMAVPTLTAAGRAPLAHATLAEVRNLADYGLGMLARHRRTGFGPAIPALRAGWRAGDLLRQARADPQAVPEGRLGTSEARRRLTLMARVWRGGW